MNEEMKMLKLVMLGLSAVLSVSNSAWAHDETMHKANATHGKVAAIRGEQLTLTTDAGPIAVTLTDATKIERDKKDVGRDALTSGTPVAIIGTKVPGQGLVAKEIVLGDDNSGKEQGSKEPAYSTDSPH